MGLTQHLLSHPAAGLSGRLGLLPTRLTRFSRSGQTEWHPWGPQALGHPPLLFRRALWTPPPPWASVHPAPAENYTLSSNTVSLHRRNRHSLAQNKHVSPSPPDGDSPGVQHDSCLLWTECYPWVSPWGRGAWGQPGRKGTECQASLRGPGGLG